MTDGFLEQPDEEIEWSQKGVDSRCLNRSVTGLSVMMVNTAVITMMGTTRLDHRPDL